MPKEKCVLIIGNGVSIDFIKHFQLDDRINVKQLIPPPDWIQALDIPLGGTGLTKALWSHDRYPELFEAWKAYSATSKENNFQAFCDFGLSEPAFFHSDDHPDDKSFYAIPNITNRSPGIQLRYYLWNLFLCYDVESRRRLKVSERALLEWPWGLLLIRLFKQFNLTIVSYNYDYWFEPVITSFNIPTYVPAANCLECWKQCDEDSVCVLKPHGTIAHASHHVFGSLEGAGFSAMLRCKVSNDIQQRRFLYPPDGSVPYLPDLVPPGHSLDHLADTRSGMAEAVDAAMLGCNRLICAGFSAAGPDENEFRQLTNNLRECTRISAVGLSALGDDNNNSSRTLQEVSMAFDIPYRFFDASEIDSMPEWLA